MLRYRDGSPSRSHCESLSGGCGRAGQADTERREEHSPPPPQTGEKTGQYSISVLPFYKKRLKNCRPSIGPFLCFLCFQKCSEYKIVSIVKIWKSLQGDGEGGGCSERVPVSNTRGRDPYLSPGSKACRASCRGQADGRRTRQYGAMSSLRQNLHHQWYICFLISFTHLNSTAEPLLSNPNKTGPWSENKKIV